MYISKRTLTRLLSSLSSGRPLLPGSQSRPRCMSVGAFTKPVPFDPSEIDKAPAPSVAKHKEKIKQYEELVQQSLAGGGARGIERHVKTNKKVLIRDRIKLLLDSGAPFVEIGALAGFEMPYGDLPGAGVVAGIGRINGIYCLISGNDATVKAGTYYPITVIKSQRLQTIAELNRLPTVYMPDSGGAFLPLQSEIFIQGGRGFYNQAVMSSKGIPQIAVVCGSCTAGGAYNPTMSDEAVIIDRIGKIFLGGPPLVKAALGEVVSDEDLGGAWMHSSVSGCTDYFARIEPEGFEMCREIVESLNMTKVPHSAPNSFDEPNIQFQWEDLEGKDHFEKVEMYGIISNLLDGSKFKEFKAFYGPGLIVGQGYIQGSMVGVVANIDAIGQAEALKATHFLNMCNRRNTPVIFLQNSLPPLQSNLPTQGHDENLKFKGTMAAAVAMLSVPKLSLTLSAICDDDHITMCGPSFEPNLNFMWPCSRFTSLEMSNHGEVEESEENYDAFYAAHHMITDALILPRDTRNTFGEVLRILKQQELNPMKEGLKYPVFRM